ncbi:MAG: OmpA family protein [Intrasporangiaceae bacterium]|nr:OmpA family protein [Intrasporangiaceae bacterium]
MRRPLVVVAGAALALAGLPGALAEPDARPTPSPAELAASITDLDLAIADLDLGVTDLDLRIDDVDRSTTDGDETVIALTTDVLFGFDEADLPANAPAKIEEVLADVPEGTAVSVEGHTDSMGTEDYNQDLSERRARAVADAIAEVRPDLELDVAGFGMSRPVADNETNGEDNPEGRALNRRVEIRYAD